MPVSYEESLCFQKCLFSLYENVIIDFCSRSGDWKACSIYDSLACNFVFNQILQQHILELNNNFEGKCQEQLKELGNFSTLEASAIDMNWKLINLKNM